MRMKAIKNRGKCYTVFFVVSICLTAWFSVKLMLEAAFVSAALNIILLMLLVRQSRLLYNANLILNNRILSVPSVIIYMSGVKERMDTEEITVSTFGIMVGSKIYKWGCDGMYGVRLNAVEIDRSRIHLTFSDGINTMRTELLHGMVDEQTVMRVKQKLLCETGVEAAIY